MGIFDCDYKDCVKCAVYNLSNFKENSIMRRFLRKKYNFCYEHLQLFFDNYEDYIKFGVITFTQGPPK